MHSFEYLTAINIFSILIWGWYQASFAFFFAIILSIVCIQQESIKSLIFFACSYWISFCIYCFIFLLLFFFLYFFKITCSQVVYNYPMNLFIAFIFFIFQSGLFFFINKSYKIDINFITKMLFLSELVATFFVYILAQQLIL